MEVNGENPISPQDPTIQQGPRFGLFGVDGMCWEPHIQNLVTGLRMGTSPYPVDFSLFEKRQSQRRHHTGQSSRAGLNEAPLWATLSMWAMYNVCCKIFSSLPPWLPHRAWILDLRSLT